MSVKMHVSIVAFGMEVAATCAIDILKLGRATWARRCSITRCRVGAVSRLTTQRVLDALVFALRPGYFFARALGVRDCGSTTMSVKMHVSIVALSMEMAATCAIDVLKLRRATRTRRCFGTRCGVGIVSGLTTQRVLDALAFAHRPGYFFARALGVRD